MWSDFFQVMNRSILLIAVICALLSSCGRGEGGAQNTIAGDDTSSVETSYGVIAGNTDLTSYAMHLADSALSCMTLEQKVGQCFMPSILTSVDTGNIEKLRRYVSDCHVGGIVLLKGTLKSAASMADMVKRAEVPLFVAIDAEWGLGMRLEDAPRFPRNGALGPGANELLLYDYGNEVARECRRVGINMVLGPVVDVTDNPGGVIGSRSFGGDPHLVADMGVAYAKGVENGGVMSVAKHFPGHGSPQGDSHVSLPVIKRSLHQLDSIDLYPFRSYIDAGLSGVMVGHLAVPAIDPHVMPAAVSPVVIQDLLRGELGFKGLVLTDALNMGGIEGYGASEAIMAGADIVVGPADTRGEIEKVVRMVRSGRIGIDVIDDRVRRILFRKFLIGLHHDSPVPMERLREDVKGEADSLYMRLSS